MKLSELGESLAALAHDQWGGWMCYLFDKASTNPDGSVTIPPELVKRWKRQVATAYADLPEDEKESDRTEAKRVMAILAQRIEAKRAGKEAD